MKYVFFYSSAAVILTGLIIIACFKRVRLAEMLIAIASIAWSLTFDIVFGELIGLYQYTVSGKPLLYLLLGAVFVYTPLNIIYTVFAPAGIKRLLAYTAAWIAVMLLFEYASLLAGVLVFTGWRMIPWSVVTYIVTYLWINILHRYLVRKIQAAA